ncbi:hypothetical protein GCM10007890_48260 [Methylobacterium tardum]|uniref:Uncharacterized protein n=1 Tax=Methylobacterium tardum TaxID=374432 RepID=A0AA37TPB8_9HYPH|nr:hypothetical protein GCM10007890_48260 [Methylobacterium tardum]
MRVMGLDGHSGDVPPLSWDATRGSARQATEGNAVRADPRRTFSISWGAAKRPTPGAVARATAHPAKAGRHPMAESECGSVA